MARFPKAQWLGSPNDNPGAMVAYDNLVLHRAQGSYASATSWFQNTAAQVSAHFVVDNVSGQIGQCVDTADEAWAEASGNPRNISVEIAGVVTDPVSSAAVTTLGQLFAWCHVTHGVRLQLNDNPAPGNSGLGWHGMGGVAWGDHPDCPGQVVLGLRPTILAEAVRDLNPTQSTVGICVAAAATADGKGYWQVSADGGVFAFGDAEFKGNLYGKPLAAPIVDLISGPNGGYWLVGADGGVFCFGESFFGSLAGKPLAQPVFAGTAMPDGKGYRLFARDFGVFNFGDAPFYGNATTK